MSDSDPDESAFRYVRVSAGPIMHSCASLLENITSLGNRNSSARVMGALIRIPYRRAFISYVSYLDFRTIALIYFI